MDIELERLMLDVPGLSSAQGTRLAQLVGQRLADGGTDGMRSHGHLSVSVAAPAGASLEQLASLIATELRRQMLTGVGHGW